MVTHQYTLNLHQNITMVLLKKKKKKTARPQRVLHLLILENYKIFLPFEISVI